VTEFIQLALARPEWSLAAALAIGLLIGTERERRKGTGPGRGAAGVRTFALVALLGGVTAYTGMPALEALAGLFVAGAVLLSYALGDRSDPGITSEVALLLAFCLGAIAQTHTELALGVSVVVTVLLAARTKLHRLVRKSLSERELEDGLILGFAALVALPLLPDGAVDPWGMVEPRQIWRLLVTLLTLSALGHAAQRLLGPSFGPIIAGLVAGFVSSTAAIAALGQRAKDDPQTISSTAAGAVAALLGSFVYLVLLVASTDARLFLDLLPSFAGALLLSIPYGVWLSWSAAQSGGGIVMTGRAFDLRSLALFALLVTAFAGASTLLADWIGARGAVAMAAATGIIDVHATAISVATLAISGRLSPDNAVIAILLALTTSFISKLPLSSVAGPRGFALRVWIGLGLLAAGLWTGHGVAGLMG
jgi:uncharacterized membrane protein (DUF4010 family)